MGLGLNSEFHIHITKFYEVRKREKSHKLNSSEKSQRKEKFFILTSQSGKSSPNTQDAQSGESG